MTKNQQDYVQRKIREESEKTVKQLNRARLEYSKPSPESYKDWSYIAPQKKGFLESLGFHTKTEKAAALVGIFVLIFLALILL